MTEKSSTSPRDFKDVVPTDDENLNLLRKCAVRYYEKDPDNMHWGSYIEVLNASKDMKKFNENFDMLKDKGFFNPIKREKREKCKHEPKEYSPPYGYMALGFLLGFAVTTLIEHFTGGSPKKTSD